MTARLRVTVLMDGACMSDSDPEYRDESSAQITEYHVVNALRELGHEVSILAVREDIGAVVRALQEGRPDLVFNLTEEFRGKRRFDLNLAALLELLHVPFTGSGSIGLMLTRDKGLCKQLLSLHRVRVPTFAVFALHEPIRVRKTLPYPLIVKPVYEDGSDGISLASLVKDEKGLLERVRMVHERWKQAAVAEEFIEGRELYVSVLGNRRLTVLPAREIVFGTIAEGGPALATGRVKFDRAYRESWKISFGFADLDDALRREIERVCRRVYRVLRIRDYGRIDLRVSPDGRIVILEANANPDLGYGDEMAESAERGGIRYSRLIDRIVRHAMRRSGL